MRANYMKSYILFNENEEGNDTSRFWTPRELLESYPDDYVVGSVSTTMDMNSILPIPHKDDGFYTLPGGCGPIPHKGDIHTMLIYDVTVKCNELPRINASDNCLVSDDEYGTGMPCYEVDCFADSTDHTLRTRMIRRVIELGLDDSNLPVDIRNDIADTYLFTCRFGSDFVIPTPFYNEIRLHTRWSVGTKAHVTFKYLAKRGPVRPEFGYDIISFSDVGVSLFRHSHKGSYPLLWYYGGIVGLNYDLTSSIYTDFTEHYMTHYPPPPEDLKAFCDNRMTLYKHFVRSYCQWCKDQKRQFTDTVSQDEFADQYRKERGLRTHDNRHNPRQDEDYWVSTHPELVAGLRRLHATS